MLRRSPMAAYGQMTRHRLEDYGIDVTRERHHYADYIAAFDVASEPIGRRQTRTEAAA